MELKAGTIVNVLPDKDGSNFVDPSGWTVVGQSRHPYLVIIQESRYGTTVQVRKDRLVAI